MAAVTTGMVILLLIQYGLGMGYNLYGTAPTAGAPVGAFSGPLLALHVVVGTLLVIGAVYLLVGCIRARARFAAAAAAVAAASLIAAWVSGSAFLRQGQDGYSMAMAVLTGVALLCYVLSLRALTASGSDGSWSG